MAVAKLLVTQSGSDTFTSSAIDTNLTVDGKTGWNIKAIEAYWADGAAIASGDWSLSAVVSTISTVTSFVDDDEIARVSWGQQNTAGVAVTVGFMPLQGYGLLEDRVTVQPQIYCQVQSSGTSNANDVVFRVYYEIVKLSDIEVMRMLVGGA